jgi:hypothetical protein
VKLFPHGYHFTVIPGASGTDEFITTDWTIVSAAMSGAASAAVAHSLLYFHLARRCTLAVVSGRLLRQGSVPQLPAAFFLLSPNSVVDSQP